ncbi:MAG: molybdate ABC transporter permease subunit [Pseudomonadota bacterium]
MSPADIDALLTTLKLAVVSVAILLLVATPLAWWLSQTKRSFARIIEALVAMPLVLPPTVLGFYLLVLMGPQGVLGSWWVSLTGSTLSFSFAGLVIASCVHSLPFVVQPLQSAFESIGQAPLRAAHSLGASPRDTFLSVVLPMARRGYITAAVLSFAHTLGEFGVLLMVGGNIPGQTRVVSVAIYEHVEALDYASANQLSLILIAVSFTVLLGVFVQNGKHRSRILRAGS